MIRIVEKVLFVVGVLLVLLNVVGLFTSLRNPGIYQERNTFFQNDITLTQEQLYEAINSSTADRRKYVTTLTKAVSDGIAHYFQDEGIETYNLRVPPQENYLMYIASYLRPGVFLKYEFYDYRRALERGVGLCSQVAVILTEVLKEKGIPSSVVGLSNHIVVEAQVDQKTGEWWMCDPDYGVVMPRSLEEIRKKPGMVRSYYAAAGHDEARIDDIERWYRAEAVVRYGDNGAKDYRPKKYYAERILYLLIWVIPLVLMAPLGIRTARSGSAGNRPKHVT